MIVPPVAVASFRPSGDSTAQSATAVPVAVVRSCWPLASGHMVANVDVPSALREPTTIRYRPRRRTSTETLADGHAFAASHSR